MSICRVIKYYQEKGYGFMGRTPRPAGQNSPHGAPRLEYLPWLEKTTTFASLDVGLDAGG